VEVALARQQWEAGYRRLEETRVDRRRYDRLVEQLETVSGQLRRRVGQTFTLAELATAYDNADDWAREAVTEADEGPGAANELSTVGDAAFHLYARGALDYAP
jgi:predicted ABC-type ATPase